MLKIWSYKIANIISYVKTVLGVKLGFCGTELYDKEINDNNDKFPSCKTNVNKITAVHERV